MQKKDYLITFSIFLFSLFIRFFDLSDARFINPDSYKLFLGRNFEAPFTNLIYGIFFSFFGNKHHVAIYFSAVCGVLNIIFTYYVTEKIFSKKVALISTVFLSLSGIHCYYSRIGYAYMLNSFLVLISFLFLYYFSCFRKYIYLVISGVFTGLSLLSYFPSYPVAAAFLFLLFYQNKHKYIKNITIFSTCFLLPFLLFEIYFQIDSGDSYFKELIKYGQRTEYFLSSKTDFLAPFSIFGKILIYGGFIQLFYILFAIHHTLINIKTAKNKCLNIVLIFLSITFLVFSLMGLLKFHTVADRHFIYLMPFMCMILGFSWVSYFDYKKNKNLEFFLLIIFLLLSFPHLINIPQSTLKIKPVLSWIKKNYIEKQEILTFLDLYEVNETENKHFIPGYFIENINQYNINWLEVNRLFKKKQYKYLLTSGIANQANVGYLDKVIENNKPIMKWANPIKIFKPHDKFIQDFKLYSIEDIQQKLLE